MPNSHSLGPSLRPGVGGDRPADATGSGCAIGAKTLSHLVNCRQAAPAAAVLKTGGAVAGRMWSPLEAGGLSLEVEAWELFLPLTGPHFPYQQKEGPWER